MNIVRSPFVTVRELGSRHFRQRSGSISRRDSGDLDLVSAPRVPRSPRTRDLHDAELSSQAAVDATDVELSMVGRPRARSKHSLSVDLPKGALDHFKTTSPAHETSISVPWHERSETDKEASCLPVPHIDYLVTDEGQKVDVVESFGDADLTLPTKEILDVVVPDATKPVPSAQGKVVYLSLCFVLLFTAFNLTQNFLTTLFPNVGFYSLAAMYAMFALSSLVSPTIGAKIGVRKAILCGAILYVIFMGAAALGMEVLLIVASGVCGFGSGMLWVHQGLYLAYSSPPGQIGKYTSIFYSIFNMNSIVGNGLGLILIAVGVSMKMMVYILFGVSTFSILALFFSKEAVEPEVQGATGTTETSKPAAVTLTIGERIALVWTVAKTRQSLFLIWCFLSAGVNSAFSASLLPLFINENIFITVTFLVYGITSFIACTVAGKVFDRRGALPLVSAQLLTCLGGMGLLLVQKYQGDGFATGAQVGIVIALGVLFGVTDTMATCLTNMGVGKYYPVYTSSAFGLYRCCFCLGFLGQALMSSVIRDLYMMAHAVGWLCLGIVGFLYYERVVAAKSADVDAGPYFVAADETPVPMTPIVSSDTSQENSTNSTREAYTPGMDGHTGGVSRRTSISQHSDSSF